MRGGSCAGFCLDGPECKHVHPSFKIPEIDPLVALKKLNVVCHLCSEPGHKVNVCPKKLPQVGSDDYSGHHGMVVVLFGVGSCADINGQTCLLTLSWMATILTVLKSHLL